MILTSMFATKTIITCIALPVAIRLDETIYTHVVKYVLE